MSEYLAEHWVLSIIATIVLGAIGSGLWDAALKPISRRIGSTLFTVLTFGAKRARDKIYRGAAMGHHELPSLYILLMVLTIGVAVLITSQVLLYVKIYVPGLSGAVVGGCSEKEEAKQRECIRERVKEKLIPTLQVLSLVAIFLVVIIFYRFGAINRMNLVTTYYEQCLKSVRPFLKEGEFLVIEQRYSTMTTKEEYEAIVRRLADVATANGASLPESYL